MFEAARDDEQPFMQMRFMRYATQFSLHLLDPMVQHDMHIFLQIVFVHSSVFIRRHLLPLSPDILKKLNVLLRGHALSAIWIKCVYLRL